MSKRNWKWVRAPICAACGQPYEPNCPCGEGSLEPLLAYAAMARHIQETYATLKGQRVTTYPDFASVEAMEREMKDLF